MQPIAVSNFDSSIDQAISGAIDKLKSALDTVFGKMQNR
jgi:hypothetical protein